MDGSWAGDYHSIHAKTSDIQDQKVFALPLLAAKSLALATFSRKVAAVRGSDSEGKEEKEGVVHDEDMALDFRCSAF